jgi:hypothetical protein
MFKKILSLFSLTQTQRNEIRDEIDLFKAMNAHSNWKMRLMDYLDGNSDEILQTRTICVDNLCELGIWIHGQGQKRFGEYPLFQQLVAEHAKFHHCAAKVVEARHADNEALAHMILTGEFTEQSRKTVKCIAKLHSEIEGELLAA